MVKFMLFHQITDIYSPEFLQALEIYYYSFPYSERRPIRFMIPMLKSGATELFVLSSENTGEQRKIMAIALINKIGNTGFYLWDYLAVESNSRGKGIGSVMLKHITDHVTSQNCSIILETEHPDFGENKPERAARIAFYLRNGAKLLDNVFYALPDFSGHGYLDMQLMVIPATALPSPKQLSELIKYIYTEFYKRKQTDSTLELILKHLQQN